jgi:hypothetical protein
MHDQTDFDSERDEDNTSRWRLLIDGSIVDVETKRAAPVLRLAIDGSLFGVPHTLSEFTQREELDTDTNAAELLNSPDSNTRPNIALVRNSAGRWYAEQHGG